MTKKNHGIRMLYNGFGFLVDNIDWMGYSYMIDWRNDLMKWRVQLEDRYSWLKEQ